MAVYEKFILVDTFFLILKVLFAKKFSYLTFFLEDIYFGVLQENLTLAIYWKMISLAFYEKLYFWRFTKSSLSAVLFFFWRFTNTSKTPKFSNFGVLRFWRFTGNPYKCNKENGPIRGIVTSYNSLVCNSEDFLKTLLEPIVAQCKFAVESLADFKTKF